VPFAVSYDEKRVLVNEKHYLFISTTTNLDLEKTFMVHYESTGKTQNIWKNSMLLILWSQKVILQLL
jgi:hypothetical protein